MSIFQCREELGRSARCRQGKGIKGSAPHLRSRVLERTNEEPDALRISCIRQGSDCRKLFRKRSGVEIIGQALPDRG
jgi:hypothetical protein